MNRLERFVFRKKLFEEHKFFFGRRYFCQVTLVGIDGKKYPLEAHHIAPVALFPSKKLDLRNGVLIDRSYHRTLHSLYSLEVLIDAIKGDVENNYGYYSFYFRNLIMPNGARFVPQWTALLVSKSLLDW